AAAVVGRAEREGGAGPESHAEPLYPEEATSNTEALGADRGTGDRPLDAARPCEVGRVEARHRRPRREALAHPRRAVEHAAARPEHDPRQRGAGGPSGRLE